MTKIITGTYERMQALINLNENILMVFNFYTIQSIVKVYNIDNICTYTYSFPLI